MAQIQRLLDEAWCMGTVEWIDFEGGEPFLDECHDCFAIRRALRERFPAQPAPPLVYDVEHA